MTPELRLEDEDAVGHYLVGAYDALERVDAAVDSVKGLPSACPPPVHEVLYLDFVEQMARRLGFTRLAVAVLEIRDLLTRVPAVAATTQAQLGVALELKARCLRQILASITQTGREPGRDHSVLSARRAAPSHTWNAATAGEDTEPALRISRALRDLLEGLH